ncbi:ubiquitinyl hydrolase 1 [Trifolium repens]|nr:ubiquitinyl hydrolase 1 [Trifolium repens]
MKIITGRMTGDSENESRISQTGTSFKKRKTTNSVFAQSETANTVDSQPVKYPSPFQFTSHFEFTWRIDGFSGRNTITHYSDVFLVGGFKWRVLIYPKGNNVKDYLSMYLDVADSANLPNDWSSYALFRYSFNSFDC